MGNLSFAQEFETVDTVKYTCLYLYSFQQDSTSKYSAKSQEMVLQIRNRHSKFISANKLYSDSIIKICSNESVNSTSLNKILPLLQGSSTHSYCKYRLYKNFEDKGNLTLTEYLNRKHIKTIEKASFKWQIAVNADTTIMGYKCTKATTQYAGREYTAWFTMDIPISDGPYKFQGLPGLIVNIQDSQNQHSFQLTGFRKSTHLKSIFFVKNKYVEVSPEEHVKALNYHNAQLYNQIHSNSITFDSEETKARALARLKTRNNYIELY
jgi:GLPGLI family protein